jgi:hypothetical protein
VEVHGFASQGFAYSDHNNYLTMKTSEGSFAATDAGANISMQVTDRLRIGAQVYLRNIGELGNWHPALDWGFADYRFRDWFGLRGGKVKTALGLFNDVQDNEFLHTWALLPQSIYSLDLRGANLAHIGGDAYGVIPLRRLGHLEYTVYGGQRVFDPYGGYPFSLHAELSTPAGEFHLRSESGTVIGEDLRWVTPFQGLTLGASHADFSYVNHGEGDPGSVFPGYTSTKMTKHYRHAFYFDYALGRFRLYAEFQRYWEDTHVRIGPPDHLIEVFSYTQTQLPWYAAVSYRIHKRLDAGTYHSRFNATTVTTGEPFHTHLYDQAVTARFDVNLHWDVKVEGHFMRGIPTGFSQRGFYQSVNPQGYENNTNLLVIRTGIVF